MPVPPNAPAGPDAATTSCLDDEAVAELVSGSLDPERLAAAQRHLATCSACLALVSAVAGDGAEPVPAGDAAPRRDGFTPPATFDEFRLLRPLGRGAMGLVYLALDTVLGRLVAIKFVTGLADFAEQRPRFLQEARAVARLVHPNVVTLFRVGEVDEHPYLVSEYVRGTPLDALPLPLPSTEVLALAIDLARGLCAAHRQGVLHRDIKPANAIRAPDGTVKLLDFGLAKLGPGDAVAAALSQDGLAAQDGVADGAERLTATGALMGTPRYLAPEGWQRQPATPERDVFAVGALLYELAAGRPAYQADSIEALRQKVLAGPPPPLATVAADLDPELGRLIDRCLAHAPAERPRDGAELLQALTRLGAGRPSGLRRAGRFAWSGWLGGGVLLVAGLVGGGLALRGGMPTRERLVALPGGPFTMGSTPEEIDAAFSFCQQVERQEPCPRALFEREQPQRQVQLAPFRLDATEVTNRQFAAWLNRLPRLRVAADEAHHTRWVYDGETALLNLYPTFPTYGLRQEPDGRFQPVSGYADRPVTQVTWLAAERYCRDRGGRLPTEAEWEYAARPRPGDRFPWGIEPPRCDGVVFGRLAGQECAGRPVEPQPVGSAPQDRTPQGIYDLAGNVAEWVADRFVERYPACPGPCVDPVVTAAAEPGPVLRVFRGGDWAQVAAILRSAGRGRWRQDEALQNVGFRCAAGP